MSLKDRTPMILSLLRAAVSAALAQTAPNPETRATQTPPPTPFSSPPEQCLGISGPGKPVVGNALEPVKVIGLGLGTIVLALFLPIIRMMKTFTGGNG